MRKKVIFWTGLYSPSHEAVSKEIRILHRYFPGLVYGISSQDLLRFGVRERYLVHYFRPYRLAPKLVPLLERYFDLSHVFQNFESFYYLNSLTKRPIVLTGAAGGPILEKKRYERVDRIVVESERDRSRLLEAGLEPDRVRLIYPGLELDTFSFQEPRADFTVLFASSPFESSYLRARGVDLLLSAAQRAGDCQFLLLWRTWGDTVPAIRPMVKGLKNVTLLVENVKDINAVLGKVHAVIAPFTTVDLAKPCPNSLLEGLAAGKPALASDKVGVAGLVRRERCGVVFEATEDSLLQAISELRNNYRSYQDNARPCAERHFASTAFVQSYQALYDELW